VAARGAATPRSTEPAAAGTVLAAGGGSDAAMRAVLATLEDLAGRTFELIERPAAAGDIRRTSADTTRIERDLGWRATTQLEDGLRAQWEWASVRVAAR